MKLNSVKETIIQRHTRITDQVDEQVYGPVYKKVLKVVWGHVSVGVLTPILGQVNVE
jgi:hypothetical protein